MFNQWAANWFGPAPLDTAAQLSVIALEYPKEELARATNGFNQSAVLGKGNYGAVYKGVMKDGNEVAIKQLEIDENESGDSGFADEVKCLSKFRHPNLVTLMGWGKAPGQRFIVYELLHGGDVAHRLKGVVRGQPFDWSERMSVARDAASGLSHMHNSTPKAFHRDIKSANILLDRNGTAKMADFGLSLINKPRGGDGMMVEQISGTPGYACPRYIKTGRITEQTEVFAWGMVVLEMMLNNAPACMGQNGTILYPIFQTLMPQAPGARDRALAALDPAAQWPPELAGELVDLALTCICIEEARRPDFVQVLQRVRPMCDSFNSRSSTRSTAGPGAYGYPGMSPVGSPGPGITRPQMGIPGIEGPTAGLETRPQMGLPGPAAGGSPITKPQLQYANPGTVPGSIGFEPRAAVPKTAARRGSAPGGLPRTPTASDKEAGMPVNLASDPFLMKTPKHELVEVVLECTYAGGVDVASMPPKHKCLTLRVGEQGPPWAIGRQQQPQYFARLVPDEALRSCISRNHLELSWEAPHLVMRKLSQNALLINGIPAPQQAVPLPQGVQLSFCPASPENVPPPPFLAFAIQMRDAGAVAMSGPTALPTRPDMPVPDHVVKEMQQKLEQQKQMQQIQQPPTQVRSAAPPAAAPPAWTSPRLFLFCTAASSGNGGERDLTALSPEMRTIAIPPDGRLAVGRVHQHGLFEAILGTDSIFLTFISRLHFELSPAPGQPGAFELKNNSTNPLVVGAQQIQKGTSGVLRPPGGIDFISKSMDGGSKPQVFLRLDALDEAQLNSMTSIKPAPSPPAPSPMDYLSLQGGLEEAAPPPSAKAVASPPLQKMEGGEDGPFWLELGGTALKPEFLAVARSRRLQGTEAGLSIGRCHQSQLFLEAVRDGVMQYLSREHFKIEPAEAGQYLLLPLSANPLWRVRKGERTSAVKGCSMLLEPGDAILLFTGAPDCTPDGPGSQGTLFFRFGDAWMSQAQLAVDPLAEPPSTSGCHRAFEPASAPGHSSKAPPASAWAPGHSSQEVGTGLFNADGKPIVGQPAHYDHSEPTSGLCTTPIVDYAPREGPPQSNPALAKHALAGALAPAKNALAPPVQLGSTCLSEDELQRADLGSLDLESSTHDAFSKGGFSYGR